jgi:nucleoside-diphosphate-sugar epimerase
MATNLFLLGGTGFIGAAALNALAQDSRIKLYAMARSAESAKRVASSGALPVLGDLKEAGEWQQAVAQADVVIHIAQPTTFGQRISAQVARRYEAERLALDRRLFDALPSARRTRFVYVAGNSFFGETGNGAPKDETMTPRPTGFGPYIQSTVGAARGLSGANREVILAFPGAVYGRGSWFKQYYLDPIDAGKPVMRVAGAPHWASPISVEDCGRALAHLALMDSAVLHLPAEGYFLVDDKPVTYDDFATLAAAALKQPLKTRSIPGWMLGLLAGSVVRSYMETDSIYSNAKLRATGFQFKDRTVETGIPRLFSTTF